MMFNENLLTSAMSGRRGEVRRRRSRDGGLNVGEVGWDQWDRDGGWRIE